MTKVVKFLTVVTVALILWQSCAYDDLSEPDVVNATDEDLFENATAAGYVYYQSGNLISPDPQSPHGNFKLRFNATASQVLDSNGELPVNGQFPVGSILVKEVHGSSGIALLAVIKKAPADVNEGSGWLWAEYQLDGTPVATLEGRGSQCIDCHNDAPNRDLVRTFDLH
jgi:hypothetical protein